MIVEEFDEDSIYRWPACEKWEYVKVIYTPDGHIDASPRLDFYEAALASVKRIIRAPNEIEGTAALFLFRHYMELALKGLVLGARHLKAKGENTSEIQPLTQGHDLQALWREVKNQMPKKLGAGVWPRWDHKFVEQCIEEFHALDPSSERLRYIQEKKHQPDSVNHANDFSVPICIEKPKNHVDRDLVNPVRVDWLAFLHVMQHVRDVLEAMDSDLIETHGSNAGWQAEQNSW